MINSERINIIIAGAVIVALIISFGLVIMGNTLANNGGLKTEPAYATKIFGPDIISIEIIADEDEWQTMLDNAINEEYIMVDVIVNGKKFQNVGIRPKGNSSLVQVANSGSERFSFRLKFDEYIKGQTCFGLDSFVLNNMLGDYTYMKEYISYDLMWEAGVDAPYFGFANIKVNGENWGLYLAVELYNDSYERRVFGDTSGMLYNVKSMDMGGGRPGDQEQRMPAAFDQPPMMPNFQNTQRQNAVPQGMTPPNVNFAPPMNAQMMNRDGGFGFFGRWGSNGGSLEYIDDNISSYSAIFNNVVGKGSEEDFQRVINAIKALNEGKDLETYFDVDKILRYLAAHTIVVNLDSYSSNMAQNYYIYERDGKLTILPWDYNLAWGGFQSGDATSIINFPIDTPVSGVDMANRPLINQLLSNPEYLERYHSYLQMLIDKYFADGKFETKVKELDVLISEYVKNDPTAFCTYEQYRNAVSAFITLGNLRAESVQGQLNGIVPSTTADQIANPDKLISAGRLNLSVLGSMMGGRGGANISFQRNMWGQQFGGMPPNMGQWPPRDNIDLNQDPPSPPTTNVSDQGLQALGLLGTLTLLLVAAIIFVAKLERNY